MTNTKWVKNTLYALAVIMPLHPAAYAVDVDEDINDENNGAVIYGDSNNVPMYSGARIGNPKRNGLWSAVGHWPLFAIHAAVLPNGKVITYGTGDSGNGKGLYYDVWTPRRGLTGNAHSNLLPVTSNTNIFCSAQNLLTTGQLLISGGDERGLGVPGAQGNTGIREANLFDYQNNSIKLTNTKMALDRWYPTLTVMPNGKALVHGGRVDKETAATVPELYNPVNGQWTRLNRAKSNTVYDVPKRGWYYPRTFINSAGKAIFFTTNHNELYELDVNARNGAGKLSTVANFKDSFKLFYPAVNYAKGKVLAFRDQKKTDIIDINNFTIKPAANIPNDRIWSDATVLANGEVLISGGSSKRQNQDFAIREVNLYNPKNNRWRKGASAKRSRLYHSATVLLPNGSVLVAGGGPPGPVMQRNAEIYYPPYLFDSRNQWAKRPVISQASNSMSYNTNYGLRYRHNRAVSKVSLVKLGSTTHSWDMGQAFRNIKFTRQGKKLTLSASQFNRNDMTPGYYMIFVIDSLGVPSEAKIVKLS